MRLVAELDRRDDELAVLLDIGLVGAVDHNVRDIGIVEQFLQRAETEQFVDQHLLERELLAPVQRDLQFGQHFHDDRAEFLRQFILGQRGGRFGIDAFEQTRQHLLLDLVDAGFETADLALARMGRVHPLREARHRIAVRGGGCRGFGRVGRQRRKLFAAIVGFGRFRGRRRSAAAHGLGDSELRTCTGIDPCRPVFPSECAHCRKPPRKYLIGWVNLVRI